MNTNKKKVVVIGGGTGLSVLVRGLKTKNVGITAIVTVADDGGSTGRLREELNIPAPGDIRNVLASLSMVEPLFQKVFQYRFSDKLTGQLSGHSLGNLILAALADITGDFATGVEVMSDFLNVKGAVLPSTNENVTLHAEMEDGEIVSGESLIPTVGKMIKRVFLTPSEVTALPNTIKAIREADLIVIGPGSLYTSIIPNLLIPALRNELLAAKAHKVYICNITSQPGETTNYTVGRHLQALADHLGEQIINTVIAHDHNFFLPEYLSGANVHPIVVDYELLTELGVEVICENLVSHRNNLNFHNSYKLAKNLIDILNRKCS